ncbi:MAG: DNA polymerase III subunit delta [bacterium]|nr:DNA polymerase III subunit delta [bacterium]
MTPTRLLADIQAGKFSPAYYFYGTEDHRMMEAQKYLAGQFLPNRQLATNYRRIDGKRTSAADLIGNLSVYPMLGERQVFVVTDIQQYKKEDLARIAKLLTPPDPNRVVVFITPAAKKPKKDASIFKVLSPLVASVEFNKLTQDETANQIVGKLAKASLKIDAKALKLLTEMIAGDHGALSAEINKLANYKQAGETITEADVRTMTSGYQVFQMWDIGNHITAGNGTQVLTSLRTMMAEGNSATSILYFIGQHFVSLYLVKNGKPLPDAKRQWLANQYRTQARGFSADQLERIVLQIADTDAQLRRLPPHVKPEIILETLAMQLIRPEGAR